MGAINFSLDTKLVEAIKKNLEPTVFFETGTYKGDTVFQQLNNFKKIVSVELSHNLWEGAFARFQNDHHVEIIHGDSPQVLAKMQHQLAETSVVYWLDAHWCVASGTAGEKSQCPLLEELLAIHHLNRFSVIIIDDARLFLAPPLAPHEVSEWPQFHNIIKRLYALSDEHELIVINDVILYYPISIKKDIIDYAQQFGIDWLQIGHYAEEIANLKKICEERLTLIEHLHAECANLLRISKEGWYHFFVDFPKRWTLAASCQLRGWVFHKQGIPLKLIRIRIKDKIFPGTIGLSRPDVASHFHHAPGSDQSGFAVPIELHFGINQVEIEVLTNDFWERIAIFKIIFISLDLIKLLSLKIALKKFIIPPAFFHLINRKFWILIRDYFRNKRISGLGSLAQYTPKVIKNEKYPKKHVVKYDKISIVTPSYHQGDFLEKTIQSIVGQNYPNLEYIVIDGGSQDNSPQIIEKYRAALSYSISEPDQGQSDAIQKGFSRCSGGKNDIMAYLNSDDLLLPGSLEFVNSYFQEHPEVDLIYGHRILINDQDQEVGRWFTPHHHYYNVSIIDYVPQETMFWRRRIYDQVGGIDPAFHFAMDWDLLLRMQEAGAVIKRVPYFLGCFRVHDQQKTSQKMSTIGQKEIDSLRWRSHDRQIFHQEIGRVHMKNSLESALTHFLVYCGIRF